MNAVFVAAKTAEEAYWMNPWAIKHVKCEGGYFLFERYADWLAFKDAHK